MKKLWLDRGESDVTEGMGDSYGEKERKEEREKGRERKREKERKTGKERER